MMDPARFQNLYHQYAHKLQTAIAFLLGAGRLSGDPKHLRVGIDTLKAEQAALADLLIKKGVFSEEEYLAAIVAGLKQEAERYENRVKAVVGADVQLF